MAIPDEEVDEKYWRYDEPERVEWREPEIGKQHKIAQSGAGMGFSQMPHSVQSWEGTFNGQTKLNGGGRRPKLSWQMTQYGDIGPTRLTTPIEAGRIASMPQWYIDHLRQINSEDTFIFECVNDGIPARTATAIDTAVMRVLDMLEVEGVPVWIIGTPDPVGPPAIGFLVECVDRVAIGILASWRAERVEWQRTSRWH